jgi:hypothetical protein
VSSGSGTRSVQGRGSAHVCRSDCLGDCSYICCCCCCCALPGGGGVCGPDAHDKQSVSPFQPRTTNLKRPLEKNRLMKRNRSCFGPGAVSRASSPIKLGDPTSVRSGPSDELFYFPHTTISPSDSRLACLSTAHRTPMSMHVHACHDVIPMYSCTGRNTRCSQRRTHCPPTHLRHERLPPSQYTPSASPTETRSVSRCAGAPRTVDLGEAHRHHPVMTRHAVTDGTSASPATVVRPTG